MTNSVYQRRHIRTRKGTAANVSGKRTVVRILAAARTEFTRAGYNGMTMRGVASAAGVSLGNLLYYFRSKEDLFHSLIEHTLLDYVARIEPVMVRHPDDENARFLAVIDFLVADAKKAATRQFLYQFWAVSIESNFVNGCRRRYEKFLMERMAALVKSVNRSLNPAELKQRAFILCGMVKRVSVMLGNGSRIAADLKGFESPFAEAALKFAIR